MQKTSGISMQNMSLQQIPYQRQTKKSQKFKALLFKNFSLQKRMCCTNVCQILTPLLCLGFTAIIRSIVQNNLPPRDFTLNIPQPFDIPNFYSYLGPFAKSQCLQWYLYDFDHKDEQLQQYLGLNNGTQRVDGFFTYITQSNKTCKFKNGPSSQYIQTKGPFFIATNKTLEQDLYLRQKLLNQQRIKHMSVKNGQFFPDGAIYINGINNTSMDLRLSINDMRTLSYHRNNGVTRINLRPNLSSKFTNYFKVTEGMLTLVQTFTRAYIEKYYSKTLISGYLYMPLAEDANLTIINGIISLCLTTLVPMALSLLLPVLMYSIVLQKQQKLRFMMRMNGLRMHNYWSNHIIYSLIITFFTFSIAFGFGTLILGMPLYTQTNKLIHILLLVGWGLCQISLSVFFQSFISTARTSTLIGYIISIWTTLICTVLNIAVYQVPREFPKVLFIYPPFTFGRLFYLMSIECTNSDCFRQWNQLPSQFIVGLICLYGGCLVYFWMGIYLNEIIPSEFGTSKGLLFFLPKRSQKYYEPLLEIKQNNNQDSRVLNLRKQINNLNKEQYPLIIQDLNKTYHNNRAVSNFNLFIKPNQIFGLLGPNGAGKTSIISVITGLYQLENGNIFVQGYNVKDNIQEVQMRIGVCPQFDLLWPQLTVQQHLFFYGRLRGCKNLIYQVKKALTQIKLLQFKNYKANQLSGGMKRRLSVCIAIVGNPQLVILDQPSTGLDPQNKRVLWDILKQCSKGKAMLITTHSMQQADILCKRVGIISQSYLRTVGTPIQLKNEYGPGYRLQLNLNKYTAGIQEQMRKAIVSIKCVIRNFNNQLIYQLYKNAKLLEIGNIVNDCKKKWGIKQWCISQGGLEDVFIRVVQKYEQEDQKY